MIQGWPETDCFTHMDCAVCIVASNVFSVCVPPQTICTYTMKQQIHDSTKNKTFVNGVELEQYQFQKALSYIHKQTCN